MIIIKELNNYWEIKNELWSGGLATYTEIENAGKDEEFNQLIEELYQDGIEITNLNDILWFDRDWVLEELGIQDEEPEDGNVEDLIDFEIEA